jgi:hypothetical protein
MDASQDRGSTKIEPRRAICLVQWPQLALLLECATVLRVCACMICVVCGLNISAASEFVKNKGICTRHGATKFPCQQLLDIMPTQHIIQGNDQPPPPVCFHCHLLTIARSWLASRLSSRIAIMQTKKKNPAKRDVHLPLFIFAKSLRFQKKPDFTNKLPYLGSLLLKCLKAR